MRRMQVSLSHAGSIQGLGCGHAHACWPCVLSTCLSFWGISHTLLYWQLALLPMLLR